MQHNSVHIKLKTSVREIRKRNQKWNFSNLTLNPLQPGVTYLYPLETSENLKVFYCFQGV